MADYIVAYYVDKEAKGPEDGTRHMEKFKAWIGALAKLCLNQALLWECPGL